VLVCCLAVIGAINIQRLALSRHTASLKSGVAVLGHEMAKRVPDAGSYAPVTILILV
jgi:hypothetical protein